MGSMLEKSKIAESLLKNMEVLFIKIPGGLGLAVLFVGMLLAASTGIVGATVVTLGVLSLPTMLKSGYKPSFACGTLCDRNTWSNNTPIYMFSAFGRGYIERLSAVAARSRCLRSELCFNWRSFCRSSYPRPSSCAGLRNLCGSICFF